MVILIKDKKIINYTNEITDESIIKLINNN